MLPHYSHRSRENATPSSGTSLLASSKGVPLPRGLRRFFHSGHEPPWILGLYAAVNGRLLTSQMPEGMACDGHGTLQTDGAIT